MYELVAKDNLAIYSCRMILFLSLSKTILGISITLSVTMLFVIIAIHSIGIFGLRMP